MSGGYMGGALPAAPSYFPAHLTTTSASSATVPLHGPGGVFYPLPSQPAPPAPPAPLHPGPLPTSLLAPAEEEEGDAMKCHLHSKPQLHCKFCRKYKRSVHTQARLAQAQLAQQGPDERKNAIEMTNTNTYNMNNLLRENILTSEYFKSLYQLKTCSEVVDEIYQFADHAEPYCSGNSRAPSTLFCCIYKLFMLKLTEKQVAGLLDHVDSPYIRCAGFLLLRYVHPPDKLWDWFEPYFIDNETFTPGADKVRMTTMGEYVEKLITEDKYYNTVLPRIPVKIKNLYGAQLIAMDEHRNRKRENLAKFEEISKFATKVDACSNGDWLEGTVIQPVNNGPGRMCLLVRLEDDSQEAIDIGLVSLRPPPVEEPKDSGHRHKKHKKHKHHDHSSQRHRSRSRDGHKRSGSQSRRRHRSRSPERVATDTSLLSDEKHRHKTQGELMEEFKRREREKALATGKNYARRPTSYKSSLSLKPDKGSSTSRRKSRSPSGIKVDSSVSSLRRAASPDAKRKEPSLEHRQKVAQLMEKYNKSAVI